MPACAWNVYADCDCRDCREIRGYLHPGASAVQKEVPASVPQKLNGKLVAREYSVLDTPSEYNKHNLILNTSFTFREEKRPASKGSQP